MTGLGIAIFGSTSALVGYIGPGPGLSMLGALIGLIVTVVTAIGAVLLWPLRAMLGKNGEDEEADASSDTASDGTADDASTDANVAASAAPEDEPEVQSSAET